MLKFDRQELIPAVIQDDITGDVLMLAFMNQEAFQRTRETGYTHFFSRSRNTVWRKGEQSGHLQEVRAIFVNCEENSLFLRVIQHGAGACHMGYRSCYYRRLQPDGAYETVAERLFEPEVVYANAPAVGAQFIAPLDANTPGIGTQFIAPLDANTPGVGAQFIAPLETALRQLYDAYLYLRDHDLSEESNTSRLLHESLDRVGQGTINQAHTTAPWLYLVSRLADELQELADVQRGEHVHSGQQPDTILEGSQVGYWLLLLAATAKLHYDDFTPHVSMLRGYNERYSADVGTRFIASEQQENCLKLLSTHTSSEVAQGLQLGFALIGWACAQAGISPLAPVEFDIEQMRRKGLIGG